MASFVEQATLKVVDQSSAQIAKINAELKKLFATAKSLKNVKVDPSGLNKTAIAAKKLSKEEEVSARRARAATALAAREAEARLRANLKGIERESKAYDRAVRGTIQRQQQATKAVAREAEARTQANLKAGTRVEKANAKALQDTVRREQQAQKSIAREAEAKVQASLKAGARTERANDKALQDTVKREQQVQKAIAREAEARLIADLRSGERKVRAAERVEREAAAASRRAEREAAPAPIPARRAARGAAPPAVPPTGPRFAAGFAGGLIGVGATLSAVEIGRAVAHAAKEGINDSDIGETSLKLKQLDRVGAIEAATARAKGEAPPEPKSYELARQMVLDIGAEKEKKFADMGGAFLNVGQRMLSFSEAYGVTQNLTAAKGLTSMLEETTRLLVAQGQSLEKATEESILFAKGMDAMGKLTDPKTGKFDETRMQGAFGWLFQMMPGIGKELTGSFYRNISKYLSASRFTISDEAFGAVLLMGEEMGNRAAVGYNQALKQLSGIGITKQIMESQAELGLVEAKKGKKGAITGVTDTALTAEEKSMRATDLPKFISEVVVPRIKKKIPDFDPGDPEQVLTQARKLASERTAIESVFAMMYRSLDIQRNIAEAKMRSGDVGDMRKLTEGSVRIAMVGLNNAFESVTGEALKSLAEPLMPMINQAKVKMNEMAVQFKTGGIEGGMPAMLAALAPVGLAAGVMAMRGPPQVAALGGAAAALMVSAGALTQAAGALAQSAGRALTEPFNFFSTPAGGPSNIPILERLNAYNEEAAKTQKTLTEQETKRQALLDKAAKAGRGEGKGMKPFTADEKLILSALTFNINNLRERMNTLNAMIEKALKEQGDRKVEPPAKLPYLPPVDPATMKSWLMDTYRSLQAAPSVKTPEETKWPEPPRTIPPYREEQLTKPPPWLDSVLRTVPSPSTVPNWPAPGAAPTDITTLGPMLNEASATFSTAVNGLSATSSTFASTFSSGAGQISTAAGTLEAAGSAAAGIIAAGAASAGSAYGAAAAAAISAAAANVHINVSSSGSVDTGGQTAGKDKG
jgi:hypothetical protein